MWNILVYESYKNTIALLEEAGITCETYVDEIYFRNGGIPQFLKDDLEKIPFGEEMMIRGQ